MKSYALLTGLALALTLQAQEHRHLTGYFGAGFTTPVGTVSDRLNTGWDFVFGAGYRVNKHFSLPIDFTAQGSSATVLQDKTPISGNMLLYSFTLNPTYEIQTHSPVGFYVTGGYGIYARRLQLTSTDLASGFYCDPWWGFCYPGLVPAEVVLGQNWTYKGGFNVGGGITFGSPGARFFAEMRYHYVFTTNVRTEMIPVAFGIRF